MAKINCTRAIYKHDGECPSGTVGVASRTPTGWWWQQGWHAGTSGETLAGTVRNCQRYADKQNQIY